jgi:hypothetical protein
MTASALMGLLQYGHCLNSPRAIFDLPRSVDAETIRMPMRLNNIQQETQEFDVLHWSILSFRSCSGYTFRRQQKLLPEII